MTVPQSLNNYLLISIIEPAKTSSGGIILTDRAVAQKRPRWAIVRSVGEGLADFHGVRHGMDYKPDDVIFVTMHGPQPCVSEDEPNGPLYAVHEGDVLCKIQKSAEAGAVLLPIGNFLHVDPIVEERHTQTSGGIILPDSKVEKPSRAKVIAVGPGQQSELANVLITPLVNPGDIIRFKKHALLEMDFTDLNDAKGKQYLLSYNDVLAKEVPDNLEEVHVSVQ